MHACDADYAEAPTKLTSMTRERVAEIMRELEPIDDLDTEIQCVPRTPRSEPIAPSLPSVSEPDAPQPLIVVRVGLRPKGREVELAIGLAAFLVVLIPSLYLLFG
jgi:hypothetical protein